ncbi:hypothetical protein ES702_02868 [subsurface metagenome]
MNDVHGRWDPAFEKIPQLLQTLIDSGEEVGASLYVDIGGKPAIDIWGGHIDAEKSAPWKENTITNVFSTTKTITALAALLLVDRKILDVNTKVSQYWPEFAANGKQDIEVRHILGHTSGVSGWDKSHTVAEVCEVKNATAELASQAPWWEPGTDSGYHIWTFGHLIGELVRRTTGKPLKQFIAEELAAPLNADFQLGASEQDWPRVSDVIPPTKWETGHSDPGPVSVKTMWNPILDIPFVWTPLWKNAEVGAVNGHTNARGVARLLSTVSTGVTVNGKRFLSQEAINLIFQEQARGQDLATGEMIRRGIGYALVGDGDTFVDDWMPSGRVCYWGGLGGSMGIMDVDRGITIAYVMNKMSGIGIANNAVKTYVRAIYEILDSLKQE